MPDNDAALVDTTPALDGASEAADTCFDHALDGDETDVDCGGSCPTKCADGQQCRVGIDCKDVVCTGGQCAGPTCSDGAKNGDETDVDCGGSCPKCGDTKACAVAADCKSGVCSGGKCAPPACNDHVKNGSETDVDCGGSCPKCGTQQGCNTGADCQSGACSSGRCVAATCTDLIKDGSETDVDCGGPQCNPCGVGKGCGVASDCTSGVCNAQHVCAAPSCTDGIKNGSETDIDCGGSCPPCADGKRCAVQGDCTSASYCNAVTTCVAKLGFGAGCTATYMCTSNSCVDAVCCDTPQAMCGGCRQCNLPTSMGHCTNVPVNQDPHLTCAAGGVSRTRTSGRAPGGSTDRPPAPEKHESKTASTSRAFDCARRARTSLRRRDVCGKNFGLPSNGTRYDAPAEASGAPWPLK